MRDVRGLDRILIVAAVPLFVAGALFHFPMALMALLGIVLLVREPAAIRKDPGARLVFWIFLCLWLPQLIALPDAASPRRSLTLALIYPMFPLAAVFILRRLRSERAWIFVAAGTSVAVSVWGLDVITGSTGIVEWPIQREDPRYIEGVLFSRFLVGHVAAVTSPLVFELVRRRGREHRWLWVLPLVLTALVFLSGRRVAWVMLVIAAAAWLFQVYRLSRPRPGRVALALLVPVALAALLYLSHEETRSRVDLTAGMFSTDVETVDAALSWRLDIWKTAWSAARANPVNGVGTRGFAVVYTEYAADDDFWLQGHLNGAYHPHLFALEVAVETGLPGLVGYLWALYLLCGLLARTPPEQGDWLWPTAIAALVAMLPFNSHTAMYGAYWSAVSWWLIGLAAAALSRTRSIRDDPSPSATSDPSLLAGSRRRP